MPLTLLLWRYPSNYPWTAAELSTESRSPSCSETKPPFWNWKRGQGTSIDQYMTYRSRGLDKLCWACVQFKFWVCVCCICHKMRGAVPTSMWRIAAVKSLGRPFISRITVLSFHSSCSSLATADEVILKFARLRNLWSARNRTRKYSDLHSKESKIPPEEHATQTILQRLHNLEEYLRVRGYSVLRWGLSVIIVTAIAIYVFREPLRENMADEVADVASRSLGESACSQM